MRENPAKRRAGWTTDKIESAPPSFVGRQARFGGQRCDSRSVESPLQKQQYEAYSFADVGKLHIFNFEHFSLKKSELQAAADLSPHF